MDKFIYNNNVRTRLYSNFNIGDVSLNIVKATAPYNDPYSPSGDEIGVLTITDSEVNPTKIEIINYTALTDNGSYITLSGITRGRENTNENNFIAGNFCMQAVTKAYTNQIYELDVENDIISLSASISDNIDLINALELNTTSLSNIVNQNSNDIISLSADIDQNSIDIQALSADIDQNSIDINQNTNDIQALSADIDQNSIDINQNTNDIQALSAYVDQTTKKRSLELGNPVSGDFDIDLSTYSSISLTLSGNINFDIIGDYEINQFYSTELVTENAGSYVTGWADIFDFVGATYPSFTTGKDSLTLVISDGGLTCRVFVNGLDIR